MEIYNILIQKKSAYEERENKNVTRRIFKNPLLCTDRTKFCFEYKEDKHELILYTAYISIADIVRSVHFTHHSLFATIDDDFICSSQ